MADAFIPPASHRCRTDITTTPKPFREARAARCATGAKTLDHAPGPLALSPPMISGTHISILPRIRGRWRHATD
jgi:hypothetical protein